MLGILGAYGHRGPLADRAGHLKQQMEEHTQTRPFDNIRRFSPRLRDAVVGGRVMAISAVVAAALFVAQWSNF